jgi:hypothetical protein
MRAFIAITLCFSLACAGLNAQEAMPLVSEKQVYTFRVIAASGKLALEWQANQAFKETRKRFLQIESITIEQADMVFYYLPSTTKDNTWPDFSATLTGPDGKIFSPPADRWQEMPPAITGEKRRALIDVAEDVLRLGQTWQLTLTHSLYGHFDCTGQRPAFSASKQWPYWAAAAFSAGAMATALNLNGRKSDNYDLYRRLWSEGKPAEEAAPYLNDARRQSKQARTWMAIGAATLALDAALFSFQYRRVRRNQQLYDQFCNQQPPASTGALDRSPQLYIRSATPDGNAGVSLIISF